MSSSPETDPEHLHALHIGAQVPFRFAGLVLEAFYRAGVDPQTFEIAPVYDNAAAKALAGALQQQLQDQSPLALPAPKARRATKPGSLIGYLETLILKKPRPRAELKRLTEAKGQWQMKALDGRLHDLVHRRQTVVRDGDLYKANPNPPVDVRLRKLATPKLKKVPKGTSQVEVIEHALRKAHPQYLTLRQLHRVFKARKLRIGSASVALGSLIAKKRVARVAPATYVYVPSNQENGNVESRPA